MGFLFTDGCDSYAATSDLPKKWLTAESPWVWSSSAGRNGGGAVQAATTSGGKLKPLSSAFSANSTVCFAFWLKVSAAPAATAVFIQCYQTTGTIRTALRITNAGKLNLFGNAGGSTATGSVTVTDGNWHWVEWYLGQANSATNKCYVDGVVEWNASLSPESSPFVVDQFELTSILNVTITVDDFLSWDDSSGAPQLAQLPLGARQITTVRPQADGTIAFTTATGSASHYNQVNETTADGDTTYVESAGSGDQDLYDFAAMGISPVTITAVVANAYVENPNPGVINFRQVAKSNATTTDGTSIAAPASYKTLQQSFPLDPNTGAAWASATPVDAATFGIKVV